MSPNSRRLLLSFSVFAVSVHLSYPQASKSTLPAEHLPSAHKAVQLAKTGHCNQAIPLLKKAIVQTADREFKRDAGLAGVRCAMLGNQFDAAEDFLRLLHHEFPKDPEVLYTSVHTYSDLATRASQQLATSAPNSAQAHELNAESLEMQGKWEQAAKEYQTIVQHNPQMPGIHFRLGRLLLSEPKPPPDAAEQAKREFQQELAIDPSNAGAEYVLGELASQGQQWDEAIHHFSLAAKLDSGFGDAFLGWGSALVSSKNFPQAVPPLEMAVKLEPENPAAHYNLAIAYTRTGRKQEAEREFAIHRDMVQKHPATEREAQEQSAPGPQ